MEHHPYHRFFQGDIKDRTLVRDLFRQFHPNTVINFAAETHVDRSIYNPEQFVQTNSLGTFYLLEEALSYWKLLNAEEQKRFRFLQISTDEVYGSLSPNDPPSKEGSPYAPNSPYAASKAAADHMVRAYQNTFGLPTLVTHSANNFGPYQFPEKLIPLVIVNALQGKALPLYGDGLNIRNWIYVADHCEALQLILEKGVPGETYNISDSAERPNRDVVQAVCSILDELLPDSSHVPHSKLIKYVKDRPGHDRRYSLDCTKMGSLGWKPKENFLENLRKTVSWYLKNMAWVENVISGEYRDWIRMQYVERETR